MAVASVPALLELSVRRALQACRMRRVFQIVVVGQADYRMGVRDRVCYGRTCTVAKAGEPGGVLTLWVPKTVFVLAEHSLTVTLQT